MGMSRTLGFPGGSMVKNLPARCRFDPWVKKMPWRRAWQPTPIFLPGESHGWRSLTGPIHGVVRVGHDFATKSPPAPLCGNVHATIIDSYYSIKIVLSQGNKEISNLFIFEGKVTILGIISMHKIQLLKKKKHKELV